MKPKKVEIEFRHVSDGLPDEDTHCYVLAIRPDYLVEDEPELEGTLLLGMAWFTRNKYTGRNGATNTTEEWDAGEHTYIHEDNIRYWCAISEVIEREG